MHIKSKINILPVNSARQKVITIQIGSAASREMNQHTLANYFRTTDCIIYN